MANHFKCITVLLATLMTVIAVLGQINQVKAEMNEFSLKGIHKDIVKDYDGVTHINRTQLQEKITVSSKAKVVLFDVREKDEYEVSHLKDAIYLSPGTWQNGFFKSYGELVKGKTVIFYCSVGVRSSKMAKYLQDGLKKQGAKEIFNLQEGIFGWANAGQTLMTQNRETTKVHPYNDHWGQLLKSKEIWGYKP